MRGNIPLLIPKPYWCKDCKEILGWERTWDDSMIVGQVNEPCPECGSHEVVVIPLQSSTQSMNKEED